MNKGIALVTGAGSGIGRAVALGLIEDGWTVVLTGRRAAPLNEIVAMAGEDRCCAITADVQDEAQVLRLFAGIRQRFGRLDLLFNNAGLFGRQSRIDEMALADWQESVAINLTGAFLCIREAFRLMKDQLPRGGRIINNGSISAQTPRPHSAAYAATKHGVAGLTKVAALDGRGFDIACGQIDIGNASTDMTTDMAAGTLQADGAVRPETRMDVANVVEAVRLMARLPLDANVQNMTILATEMPFVGRG